MSNHNSYTSLLNKIIVVTKFTLIYFNYKFSLGCKVRDAYATIKTHYLISVLFNPIIK